MSDIRIIIGARRSNRRAWLRGLAAAAVVARAAVARWRHGRGCPRGRRGSRGGDRGTETALLVTTRASRELVRADDLVLRHVRRPFAQWRSLPVPREGASGDARRPTRWACSPRTSWSRRRQRVGPAPSRATHRRGGLRRARGAGPLRGGVRLRDAGGGCRQLGRGPLARHDLTVRAEAAVAPRRGSKPSADLVGRDRLRSLLPHHPASCPSTFSSTSAVSASPGRKSTVTAPSQLMIMPPGA